MRIINGVAVLVLGIGGSVLLYEKEIESDIRSGDIDDHFMFIDDNHEYSDRNDFGIYLTLINFIYYRCEI